jgi:hypothetical protein
MLGKLPLAVLAAISLSMASNAIAQTDKAKTPLDPNEKVCETIKPVGSRLTTKRFCATRAEWAEKRKLDREEIEKAQMLGCLNQGACGGN